MSDSAQSPEMNERIRELEDALAAVTAEKDRLQRTQDRWQSLMAASPFGIAIYRPDGSVKMANAGLQRLFELSDSEAEQAITHYNILQDQELVSKGVAPQVARAFNGHSSVLPPIEYIVETPIDKKRVRKWVEGVFFPVVEADGTLREVVSIQVDVTPLMKTEKELRRAQAVLTKQLDELDHLYASEPVGLCLMDTDLRFLRINERMAAINGLEPAEHLGRTLRDVLPGIADTIEPIYQRVIETGEPALNFEVHGVTPADPQTQRDWLVSYYPLKGWNEDVTGVTTVVQEITDVKRAQAALKESQHRLRSVIDNAEIVLWALDKDGMFTLSEGKGLALLGLRPGEVVGRSVFDVYADAPQVLADNRRALQGESLSKTVEVGGLTFEARYLPLFDDAGAPSGSIGVAVNITERTQAEAALEKYERRFLQIAENIREVFWLMDSRTRQVIYMSPAYERLTGRALADVNSSTNGWMASIHPHDVGIVNDGIAQLLESGGTVSTEHRLIHQNGDVRWVSVRTSAVPDERGETTRITGITEDITERRLAAEERQRFESKVRQAQKLESLGLLAGGIAHDFNNLLMGVLGNADLALLSLSRESPGREYVERIQTAAQRASELANQMLAYSGKGRFAVRALDLNRLVVEMGHLLASVISKKAQLSFDLAEDLPSIEADASQIRQIVMNLITNASESVDNETGTIRVSTSLVEASDSDLAGCVLGIGLAPGPYVCLEVSDTGSGIEADVRESMFDPFFTTKFTGRGLGLAAVFGIAQSHGAALRVDSRVGHGTTFSVLFPPSSAKPADREERPEEAIESPSVGTILVVDDEEIVRDVARTMLEKAGFRVVTASDGAEAVDVFERHGAALDLVLLDMTMPELDGGQTYLRMREIRPEIRVLFSSGYSEDDTMARLGRPELADFVHKPYKREDLLRKVQECLSRRDGT